MKKPPEPYSEYRHEVLERYPRGHEKHDAISNFAQMWARTSDWRKRVSLGSAAGALVEDAVAVSEPTEERDYWITAECLVNLAASCKEFLKIYEENLGSKHTQYYYAKAQRGDTYPRPL